MGASVQKSTRCYDRMFEIPRARAARGRFVPDSSSTPTAAAARCLVSLSFVARLRFRSLLSRLPLLTVAPSAFNLYHLLLVHGTVGACLCEFVTAPTLRHLSRVDVYIGSPSFSDRAVVSLPRVTTANLLRPLALLLWITLSLRTLERAKLSRTVPFIEDAVD